MPRRLPDDPGTAFGGNPKEVLNPDPAPITKEIEKPQQPVTGDWEWWRIMTGFVRPGGQPSPGSVNPTFTSSGASATHALSVGDMKIWVYGNARIAGKVIGYNPAPTSVTHAIYVMLCKGEIEGATCVAGPGTPDIFTGPPTQAHDLYAPFDVTGQPSDAYARFIITRVDTDPPTRDQVNSTEYAFDVQGFNQIFDHRGPTTAFSTNPVLCWRDALLRSRYATSSEIDEASFDDGADACDELVGGEKRYQIGLAMIQPATMRAWKDVFCASFAGESFKYRGKWRVRVGVAQPEDAYTFYEGIDAKEVVIREVKRDRPTQVKINYSDSTNEYAPNTAVVENPGISTGDIAIVPAELNIASINDPKVALRVAAIYANQAQFKFEGGFKTWTRGALLTPGMRIRLVRKSGGIDNSFTVTGLSPDSSGEWSVAIRQYSDDIYTDSVFFTGSTLPGIAV
ncbi:MAG: hypothetical protein EPN91_02425 [Salinibacterium sp.]|nr:MAG: hypothetical protein EPN91_02425 [Salinibacterium sp.]